MIVIRKAEDRGRSQESWLDSRFTFSFADYFDPEHMGFRTLRVINDDRIMGGGGFGMHPHRDMEIVTVMHEGALEHRDSIGNRSVLKTGYVQRMSAGTGVTHSEVNASATEPIHLLQIWILPKERNLKPEYEEKTFTDLKGLKLIVSPHGHDGSLRINQEADIYMGRLAAGETAKLECLEAAGYWIQVIDGQIELNGQRLLTGDGAAAEGEEALDFKAAKDSLFLAFELR